VPVIQHNPQGVFPAYRAYGHAVEVRGDARLLFISGLNGYERDGTTMPESFDEQADLIWNHIRTILASAGMDFGHVCRYAPISVTRDTMSPTSACG
jgi:2-iminobutanoate/2-iminopropanoate deaminase